MTKMACYVHTTIITDETFCSALALIEKVSNQSALILITMDGLF